jgi:hypothetical protein
MIELNRPMVDLARIEADEVSVGYGSLGRLGSLGYEDRQVEVGGRRYLRSLSAHPPSRVVYKIGPDRWRFKCSVALNDDAPPGSAHADFAVVVDERLAAAANGVLGGGRLIPLEAEFEGATKLELLVNSARLDYSHAVWLEPRLQKVSKAAKSALRDPLDRVEVEVPAVRPRRHTCIVTCASPGYARMLDNFFGSVVAQGRCEHALLAVFAVDPDADILKVAEAYGAPVIPCHAVRPINPWVKSVLYSAARVIDADVFLCCDADVMVLADLNPIFAAIEALPASSIFCCQDSNYHNHESLGDALKYNYRGALEDVDRLLGRAFGEHGTELVVNSGIFCGGRSAILSLDSTLRSMEGASRWVDHYFLREQFLFNLALARTRCGVLLDDTYNVQLHAQEVDIWVEGRQVRARWHGREARLLHFSGWGKQRYAHCFNLFSRVM